MMTICMSNRQDKLEGMDLCRVLFYCLEKETLLKDALLKSCKDIVPIPNRVVERVYCFSDFDSCESARSIQRVYFLFSDFDSCESATSGGCCCCDVCMKDCGCVQCETNTNIFGNQF